MNVVVVCNTIKTFVKLSQFTFAFRFCILIGQKTRFSPDSPKFNLHLIGLTN